MKLKFILIIEFIGTNESDYFNLYYGNHGYNSLHDFSSSMKSSSGMKRPFPLGLLFWSLSAVSSTAAQVRRTFSCNTPKQQIHAQVQTYAFISAEVKNWPWTSSWVHPRLRSSAIKYGYLETSSIPFGTLPTPL